MVAIHPAARRLRDAAAPGAFFLPAHRPFGDLLPLNLGDERPRGEDEAPDRGVLEALGDDQCQIKECRHFEQHPDADRSLPGLGVVLGARVSEVRADPGGLELVKQDPDVVLAS